MLQVGVAAPVAAAVAAVAAAVAAAGLGTRKSGEK